MMLHAIHQEPLDPFVIGEEYASPQELNFVRRRKYGRLIVAQRNRSTMLMGPDRGGIFGILHRPNRSGREGMAGARSVAAQESGCPLALTGERSLTLNRGMVDRSDTLKATLLRQNSS
jgi:hypothetical protein